jgi:hypothetical protein
MRFLIFENKNNKKAINIDEVTGFNKVEKYLYFQMKNNNSIMVVTEVELRKVADYMLSTTNKMWHTIKE